MARRVKAGLSLEEDSLGVEVIGRAAKNRSYLMDEHTLAHMREAMWVPSFFQRTSLEEWGKSGSKKALKRIREKLQDMLQT